MSEDYLRSLHIQCLKGTTQRIGNDAYDILEWMRPGGEAYICVAQRGSDRVRYVLKCYRQPTRERRDRIQILSALQLDVLPALPEPWFHAAPRAAFEGVFVVPMRGGDQLVQVEGTIAPMLDGHTLFQHLDDSAWDLDLPTRLGLALELCAAIDVLERGGLAHADLSSGNVILEPSAGKRRLTLRLIDFDGFYCEGIPLIPVSEDDDGGRSWGSDGYRARAFRRGDEASLVDCDRVALAALVFELATLRGSDRLKVLLDQGRIDAEGPGAVDHVAPHIRARWPAGEPLLRCALDAASPRDAPAPADWANELLKSGGLHP